MVKLIANYLPQYHQIPENDRWWGEGYTDWEAVKKCKPLYFGHNQPRIPYQRDYYALDNIDSIKRQAEYATRYGIYGFGIYHYWFSSEMQLLQKPAELLLNNRNIDIHYMFIWDNATWKRTWSNVKTGNDWAPMFENSQNSGNGILAELIYGNEEDWKKHLEYLLPFFEDDRYIKIDNKPLFGIFNQDGDSEIITNMMSYWDGLLKEKGFAGLFDLGKQNSYGIESTKWQFIYNPEWDGWVWHSQFQRIKNRIQKDLSKLANKPLLYDYNKIWDRIIKTAEKTGENVFLSGFVDYDDSPRRGAKGRIVRNASPEKFEKYLAKLLQISKKQNKEYLFLTAWNEWGEGAYLEPDETHGFDYLEAIKRAVDSCSE